MEGGLKPGTHSDRETVGSKWDEREIHTRTQKPSGDLMPRPSFAPANNLSHHGCLQVLHFVHLHPGMVTAHKVDWSGLSNRHFGGSHTEQQEQGA